MPFTINFLNTQQAKNLFDTHSPDSEYARRMAMKVPLSQPAPTQREYDEFAKSQCREFSEREKKFFQQKIHEINQTLLKRGVDFGDIEICFALTTGNEYCFGWRLESNVFVITQHVRGEISLESAMNPFYSVHSLLTFDLVKKEIHESLLCMIFKKHLKESPELRREFFSLLGFEEVLIELPSNLAAKIASNTYKMHVKMDIVLTKTKEMVSVVPLCFYNEHCKFDGTFKQNAQPSGLDCFTLKLFLATQAPSDKGYRLVMRDNNPVSVTLSDTIDERVINTKKIFKCNELHPMLILERIFVEYINGKKTLPFSLEQVFDKHFKRPQSALSQPESTPNFLIAYENEESTLETSALLSKKKSPFKRYH